jgi:MFS family permease
MTTVNPTASESASSTPVIPRSKQVKNVFAAVMGNTLEFYDFGVYAAFAAMIGRAFFPSHDPNVGLLLSVATFGVGFFARPLGGIVIGAYADRFGRKPAMTLTILLMAFGTGMIGLLPTYAQIGVWAPILLVVARLIQGFSAGGELGPATTFLIESAPRNRRCFYGSWQLASQNVGNIIVGIVGVTLAFLLSNQDTESWGWRIPFLIGTLIAPIGFYIRSKLDETLDEGSALDSMSAVLSDLLKNYWRQVALGLLMISGATVAQYFFIYGATYAIATLGFGPKVGMMTNLAIGISGAFFALIGGALGDRLGVKKVTVITRIIATALFYPALLLVVSNNSPAIFLAAMIVLMAFHAMSSGAGLLILPKIFPAAIRTSGLSLAYAMGVTIFGGTASVVFTWIIGATGDKLSWVWYVIAMGIVTAIATILVRLPPDLEAGEPAAPSGQGSPVRK